jgi:hypothetical protein
MTGIVPPSVVTYQYTVDNNFSRYVNVSFPFRVRITDIWFNGDASLLNTSDAEGGNNPWTAFEDSFRVLKLAGYKAKSPKVVLSDFDPPSDWNAFFGTDDTSSFGLNADASLKPTIWLGIPDETTAQVLKDSTTQYNGVPFFGAGFRSSTGKPPALSSPDNGYWFNNGWNEPQYLQNRYKTDMGVMNPDEILSLFVYNDSGDWSDYDGTGTATIHIAYTGVGEGVFPASGKTPWSDWWYD